MKSIRTCKIVKIHRILNDLSNLIRFSGQCNVSDMEHLEDSCLWATEWDMELYIPNVLHDVTAIAIPVKAIRSGPGKNGHRCRVEDVVKNRFSYTITLSPLLSADAAPLKWKLPKKEWRRICTDTVSIHIPDQEILLLRKKDGP